MSIPNQRRSSVRFLIFRRVQFGAIAYARSDCEKCEKTYPHNAHFGCGFVHKKIAQTLKE